MAGYGGVVESISMCSVGGWEGKRESPAVTPTSANLSKISCAIGHVTMITTAGRIIVLGEQQADTPPKYHQTTKPHTRPNTTISNNQQLSAETEQQRSTDRRTTIPPPIEGKSISCARIT